MIAPKAALAFFTLFALVGCSNNGYERLTEKRKADVEQCIAQLKDRLEILEAKGHRNAAMDLKDRESIRASREYHLTKDLYDASTDRYRRSLESRRLEGLSWNGDPDVKGCALDQLSAAVERDVQSLSRYFVDRPSAPIAPVVSRTQESEYDRMNREIDEAQQGVLDDYRRRAVGHSYTTGPGFRIDQFLMKSGRIVHCKTSISTYGNAVDCN